MGMVGKLADALRGQVHRAGQERHADQANGAGLALLAAAQLPDHDRGGQQLNRRLQA